VLRVRGGAEHDGARAEQQRGVRVHAGVRVDLNFIYNVLVSSTPCFSNSSGPASACSSPCSC
jgi:hypothetical protein